MARDVDAEVLKLRALGQRYRQQQALAEAKRELLWPWEPCPDCGHQNQNCKCPPPAGVSVVYMAGYESDITGSEWVND